MGRPRARRPCLLACNGALFAFFTKPQSVHHIGRFEFGDDQLEYVLINLEHAEGINTIREVVLVLRYKWPTQFRLLLKSDLKLVMEWLIPNRQAKEPSREGPAIDDYMYGQPLDTEGGWYRVFERQRYTSRLLEITQLVNTFKIELREAEVCNVLALVKRIEPDIVLIILATKLFSALSSVDIALGLTNRYFKFVRGCRYVWMFHFTERHVECVWYRSQLAQPKSFKYIAGRHRKKLSLRYCLTAVMKDVEAGRADETLGLDPRSCGNERSAANLVEEVIRLFLSCVNGKDILGALIT